MAFIVYLLTNRITGKEYVGVTTLSIEERFHEHVHSAKKPGSTTRALSLSIRKHGATAFDMDQLAVACTEIEMFTLEQHFVDQRRTLTPHGYNMTAGGDGLRGYQRSAETLQKLADAARGKKANERQLEGLRQSPASVGRRVRVWHVDSPQESAVYPSVNVAAAVLGVSYASISMWARTPRVSRSGWGAEYLDPPVRKLPKKHTEDCIRQRSEKRKRGVIIRERSGSEVGRFRSVTEAATFLGMSVAAVSRCLKGWNKSVGGLLAVYEEGVV